MNKKALIWIGIVVAALAAAYAWSMTVIAKISYDYKLKGLRILNFSLRTGVDNVVQVDVDIMINNKNSFEIKVEELYYELYYKGRILAKSSNTARNKQPVNIPGKGKTITVHQSIDLHVNRNALEILQNFKNQVQGDYLLKVKAQVFGIGFNLKNVKLNF